MVEIDSLNDDEKAALAQWLGRQIIAQALVDLANKLAVQVTPEVFSDPEKKGLVEGYYQALSVINAIRYPSSYPLKHDLTATEIQDWAKELGIDIPSAVSVLLTDAHVAILGGI